MITEFVEKIVSLAAIVPFSVDSWGRSEKHNKEVGGEEFSLHRCWLAVDVILDDPNDRPTLIHYATRIGLKIIPGQSSNRAHIQIK